MAEEERPGLAKKPSGLGRLLAGLGKRRSLVLERPPPGPAPVGAAPTRLHRANTGGLLRRRAPSAPPAPAAPDEAYEPRPRTRAQLPGPLRALLKGSRADDACLEAHWPAVLDTLRVVAPRELRHYSFLRRPRPDRAPEAGDHSDAAKDQEKEGEQKEGEEKEGVDDKKDDGDDKKDDGDDKDVDDKDEEAAGEEPPPPPNYIDIDTEKALRRKLAVREQIGQGSYGSVYAAKLKGEGQVAVKKISNLGERHARRNAREVGFLSACQHANILRVHCCYRALDTDTIWLVMELLEGGSLDEALELGGKMPPKEAARCTADLAAALVYLHAKQWAHRDLKPANAMLATEMRARRACVKLVDFSLCARLGPEGTVQTCGTTSYMPPEMTLRRPHTLSCDIWSLGIVAAALLAGGPTPNDHCRFDALFFPAIGEKPSIKGEGADFVSACLELDPAKRPSAAELLEHPWLKTAASNDEMWRLVKTVFARSAVANVIGMI